MRRPRTACSHYIINFESYDEKGKIIYEEEESSSSEEEIKEIIVHRKSKSKAKKEPVGPVEAEQIVVPPPKELSYNEMIYETSLGRIKNRINDERARTILHSVIPTYY
jgi:hypothetical protein